MAKNKYTVDYFIKKFKGIPGNKWCEGDFAIEGRRCALGHCHKTPGTKTYESGALHKLFNDELCVRVDFINDNQSETYKQKTPRSRILAALKDIKRKVNSV